MNPKSSYSASPSIDDMARTFLAAHRRAPGTRIYVEDNHPDFGEVIDCNDSCVAYLEKIRANYDPIRPLSEAICEEMPVSFLRPSGEYLMGRLGSSGKLMWTRSAEKSLPIPFSNRFFWHDLLVKAGIEDALEVWSEGR